MARGNRTFASTGLLSLVLMLSLGFALWGAASVTIPVGLRILTACSTGIAALLLVNRLTRRNRELDATLTQSERYVAAVADLATDLHLLVDPGTGELLYVNAALESLLGLDRERFLQAGLKGLLERVHPEDRGPLEALLRGDGAAAIDPERIQEGLGRLRAEDGQYRWLRVRVQVFHRDAAGRPDEILVLASDRSEVQNLQTLLPRALAFESLGAVAGGVVHDLNNALMTIQLQVERAAKGIPADGLEPILHRVNQESQRASDLSRQLVACTGRGRSLRSSQSLNDVLREALPLLERMVSDPVSLQVDFEPDLPKTLVDGDQIRHAALAMVSLAVASLGSLRGEIRIRTIRVRLEGDHTPGDLMGDFVCLEVHDTGRGLRPEQLQGLLLPDLRGSAVGLDPSLLALHWIAREHKGTLDAEGKPGEGSRLRLLFPVEAAAADPDETPEPPMAPTEGQLILVVEDETVLRGALRLGLEEAGFTVLEAEDGVEGFAAFVRNRERLSGVLLDLTMPRMNGDQLFEEIHTLRPDLPVILMSGYAESDATMALGARGLAGFLSKPCSMRAVREALVKVLEKR